MADVAAETTHNVGNLLNNVTTSVSVLDELCDCSSLEGLEKANELLSDNFDNLIDFISNDPKGMKLMKYYLKLKTIFSDEYQGMRKQIDRLKEKVYDINNVIYAQQKYIGEGLFTEKCSLITLVEDAVTMMMKSIN